MITDEYPIAYVIGIWKLCKKKILWHIEYCLSIKTV